MKTKHFFMEFIVLLAVLYIPPILTGNISHSLPYLSLSSICQLSIALLLFVQMRQNKHNNCLFLYTISIGTQTLGCLFLVSAGLQFFSSFIIHSDSSFFYSNYPSNFIRWADLFITLLASAFCEEIFYRLFMPEVLLMIIKNLNFSSKKEQYLSISAEVFSICIFALAHRYLGFLSVVNAVICGSALRRCYLRTKNIFTGTIVHFIYNLVLVIFSYLLFLKNQA